MSSRKRAGAVFRHASPARRLFGCATVGTNRGAAASCRANNRKEAQPCLNYRNFSDPLYRNPNDPSTGNAGYEPAARTNAGWGWIAGALCLVIILAIAFGVGHEPNRVASNDEAQPAATHMAPPAAALRPAPPAVPGLAPPQEPAPTPDRP